MRKGCIGTVAALALIFCALAWWMFGFVQSIKDIPDELQPYREGEAAAALVTNKGPADSARLTSHDVAVYNEAIDSARTGWSMLKRVFDSLTTSKGERPSDTNIALLLNKEMVRALVMFSPRTAAGMVRFLNRHHMSIEQYDWIRRRVLTASGLTRQEVLRAMTTEMQGLLGAIYSDDSNAGRLAELADDDIRPPIDSTERALAAPLRPRLLHDGLISLLGLDVDAISKEHRNVRINVR